MSLKVGDRVDLPHGIPVGATVKLLDANPFAVGRFEVVELPPRVYKVGDEVTATQADRLPSKSVVVGLPDSGDDDEVFVKCGAQWIIGGGSYSQALHGECYRVVHVGKD